MSVAEQRALAVVMAKSTLTDVEVMEAFLAAMQVRSPAVLRGTSNSKASGEEGSGEMSERTCQWGNRDYDADEPRDLAPCAAMATHTSCQTWPRYVCAEHKCRCSKPLADPINGKIMGKPCCG
jgi:hypothetical protein